MGIKLNNLTSKTTRLGNSRNMEPGQSSTAKAEGSNKGKEKVSAEGSGKSSHASAATSRTQSFLSSSSDSGTPIHERFPDFDAYLAHQNAKLEIRGQNAEKVLADLKKDIAASEAKFKIELAQADKDLAQAIKLDKKDKRKAKKAVAKEKAFVAKSQAKAAKLEKKTEAKLNKEGKLSARQQGWKDVEEIKEAEAKEAYERDLNAALEESAIHGHVREYFPSPDPSPRSTGTGHFDVSPNSPSSPAGNWSDGEESRGIDPWLRNPEHPLQQGLVNHLHARLDNVPGGFNAELHDPSAIPLPPARVPGESGRETIARAIAEVDHENSTGQRIPDSPRSEPGSARSDASTRSTGLPRFHRESGSRAPDELRSPSQELKRISGTLESIAAERQRIIGQVSRRDGVPVPYPVSPREARGRMSPASDTTPESPLTPSTLPSSAGTYTYEEYKGDMQQLRMAQQKLAQKRDLFHGRGLNPIDAGKRPVSPGSPASPDHLPPRSAFHMAMAEIEAEDKRLDRLFALREARQDRNSQAWEAANKRQEEAFARQIAQMRNRNRAGQEGAAEAPASGQPRPAENPAARRNPSLAGIPENIVRERVNAIEDSLRTQGTGVPGASAPNAAGAPSGNRNETAGRHPDERVAWAQQALPAALAANASVPPTRLPQSPAPSDRSSSSSSASESQASTPRAPQETTLAERMAWAREALAANPRLGAHNPNPAGPRGTEPAGPRPTEERQSKKLGEYLAQPPSPSSSSET